MDICLNLYIQVTWSDRYESYFVKNKSVIVPPPQKKEFSPKKINYIQNVKRKKVLL